MRACMQTDRSHAWAFGAWPSGVLLADDTLRELPPEAQRQPRGRRPPTPGTATGVGGGGGEGGATSVMRFWVSSSCSYFFFFGRPCPPAYWDECDMDVACTGIPWPSLLHAAIPRLSLRCL